MLSDYLLLEPLIVSRLQARMPTVKVLTADDLASVREMDQPTPAVHVIYGGDDLPGGDGSTTGRGAAQIVRQRWITCVVVQSAAGGKTSSGCRAIAGPLIPQVIAALAGAKLAPEFRELTRVSGDRALYRASFGYFPITWHAQATMTP